MKIVNMGRVIGPRAFCRRGNVPRAKLRLRTDLKIDICLLHIYMFHS